MSGPDSTSNSFDPSTWMERGKDSGPRQEPGTRAKSTGASFDPSTWAHAEQPEDKRPAAPEVERPRSDPRRRQQYLAMASAVAIVLTGAVAARLTGTPPSPAAAPAAAIADAPAAPGHSRRTVIVPGPEQVLAALVDLGIDPATAQGLSRQVLAAVGEAPGEIRLTVEIGIGDGQAAPTVAALEATRNDGSGVLLSASADGSYAAQALTPNLETRVLSARGEMDTTSFYSSAVAAGVHDSLISDFAAAFSFDVDFQREVKPGDIFEAAFEQAYNPAGEAVGMPRLLFASLRTDTKSLRLYRFKPPGDEKEGWFDANGRSNVRSLMRTPVDGARVSSQFGYRVHPIQGFRKLHRGTDFAAPTGTPVYASGNASVISASPAGGAGNLVKLQHDNGWVTKYMHLSAFAPGMAPGVRVTQGQLIGKVGSTGASTGPHLHYEVWINDEPVDSMTIDTGTGVTLDGAALAAFRQERDRIDLARSQRQE